MKCTRMLKVMLQHNVQELKSDVLGSISWTVPITPPGVEPNREWFEFGISVSSQIYARISILHRSFGKKLLLIHYEWKYLKSAKPELRTSVSIFRGGCGYDPNLDKDAVIKIGASNEKSRSVETQQLEHVYLAVHGIKCRYVLHHRIASRLNG